MSVVMPSSRELTAGPTAGLLPCKAEVDEHQEGGGGGGGEGATGRSFLVNRFLGRSRPGDLSGSSSSIGVPEDSSESEDEDAELQSNFRPSGPQRTLGSLQDSLPVKRGLSSHFTGKSKSFASLADVVTKPCADLAKTENPFNKRRRVVMMANRSQWPRRASCSSLLLGGDDDNHSTNTVAARLPPMPLRPLREEDEHEHEHQESYDDPCSAASTMVAPLLPPLLSSRPMSSSFTSPRSFSLTHLQDHHFANDLH